MVVSTRVLLPTCVVCGISRESNVHFLVVNFSLAYSRELALEEQNVDIMP